MQILSRWYQWIGCGLLASCLLSACSQSQPPRPIAPPPSPSQAGLGEGDLADPGSKLGEYLQDGPAQGGLLQDVYFGYDAYDLSSATRSALQRNANWLQSNPEARVEIEGHCDNRGTVEYNLALGAKRSRAARDYLVSLGVSPQRLSTISYGEELPLCRQESDACWQQNRRAHFLVLNR